MPGENCPFFCFLCFNLSCFSLLKLLPGFLVWGFQATALWFRSEETSLMAAKNEKNLPQTLETCFSYHYILFEGSLLHDKAGKTTSTSLLGIFSASAVLYISSLLNIWQRKHQEKKRAHSGNLKQHSYFKTEKIKGKKKGKTNSLIPDIITENVIKESSPRPYKESHNWSLSILQHKCTLQNEINFLSEAKSMLM